MISLSPLFIQALRGVAAPLAISLLATAAHAGAGVWRLTPTTGWERIDSHPDTVSITAGPNSLLKLHGDGRIFRLKSCFTAFCSRWEMLDNNSATNQVVTTANGTIYQKHASGAVFRYTGVPCSGESCPGWEMIDHDSAIRTLVGGGSSLVKVHFSGAIFVSRENRCATAPCTGWDMVDNNPDTAEVKADGWKIRQRHHSGAIYKYELWGSRPCDAVTCYDWQWMGGGDAATAAIATGGSATLRMQSTGSVLIWRVGDVWQTLDTDGPTAEVKVTGDGWSSSTVKVYKRDHSGEIYQWDNKPGCWTCWTRVSSSSRTVAIELNGNALYRLDRY